MTALGRLRDVVVLGGSEWGPTTNHTPQQMARAASEAGHRVLYVGRRRQESTVGYLRRFERVPVDQVLPPPRLTTDDSLVALEVGFSLQALPLASNEALRRAQLTVLKRQLDQGMARASIEPARATLLLYWWHFPEVLDAYPWRSAVFDVIDDHSALSRNTGRPRHNDRTRRLVRRTRDKAPAVTAVTARLAESLGADVIPVPVAFDFTLAGRVYPPNPSWAPEVRPAVAFAGGVDDRTDWTLVHAVATERPDWSFHFIGGSAPSGLPKNVRSHGGRPYGELLAMVSACDVAWLPFVVNDLTTTSDFLKTWDYRFSGLRVVATRLPSTERAASLDEAVETVPAGDVPEWLIALDRSLARGTQPLSPAVRAVVDTRARLARLLDVTG